MKNFFNPILRHKAAASLAAVVLIIGFLVSSQSSVEATGPAIIVNSATDVKRNDGQCTLREAIIAANKGSSSGNKNGECLPVLNSQNGYTIFIDTALIGNTITLDRTDKGGEDSSNTGDLDVGSNITIETTGALAVKSASGFTDRIFHILSGGKLTADRLTVRGGKAKDQGGAFFVASGGVLNLTNSTLTQNNAGSSGGAIYNNGTTNLNYVMVKNNTTGAGVVAGGVVNGSSAGAVLTVNNSYFDNNSCAGTINGTSTNNLGRSSADCNTGKTDSGGITLTEIPPGVFAIPAGSNAIDNGSAGGTTCPAIDQLGNPRPANGQACDIGPFELAPVTQNGPIFVVNTSADTDDGVCSTSHCSLREAVNAANARTNDSGSVDEIRFNIPGSGVHTIALTSLLPEISDGVAIKGTTQPTGSVALNGGSTYATGLKFNGSSNSSVSGLGFSGFTTQAILIANSNNNHLEGNTINGNGGKGIVVNGSSLGNTFAGNSIDNNGDLGIDLGNDGVTLSDFYDGDSGPNGLQNPPILTKAVLLNASNLLVQGSGISTPDYLMHIEFFASLSCDSSFFGEGSQSLGSIDLTLNEIGYKAFINIIDLSSLSLGFTVEDGNAVTAVATAHPVGGGSDGTSEFSRCVTIGPNNDTWVNALPLQLDDTGFAGVQTATINIDPVVTSASVDQYLSTPSQSRWFSFPINPGDTVIGELTNLPENYDLMLFRDIQQTYDSLGDPDSVEDLALLNAEYAPDMFAPDMFAPDMFAPDMFAPDMYAPDQFAPDQFAPDMFAPDQFAPDQFAPDQFAPDMFAPDMFAPDQFAPDQFAPDQFAPDQFASEMFTPDMYAQDQRYFASALAQSAIAISAFDGTADERVEANTWNENGNFYLRVNGRNGVYNPNEPFTVKATVLSGACGGITASYTPTPNAASAPATTETLILYDSARMAPYGNVATLEAALADLAADPSVNGVLINLNDDQAVRDANAQADANYECVYAKNVLAQTIQKIIDAYRDRPDLDIKNIVLVGNDNVIPFYRYPDHSLLANESNYEPPVDILTASEASLRLGYILGQDEYGAGAIVERQNTYVPIPKQGVGRLVENVDEIVNVIDAYIDPPPSSGQVLEPSSAFVSGYDFLEDAAQEVASQLGTGMGTNSSVDTLINPSDLAPADPASWTADDLRDAWLNSSGRFDLVFLAGHFSSSSTLAADYQTRLLASEIAASTKDMTNTIVFSNGCHISYNLVNEHGIPGVSVEPDWAQAFARKGALLFAGTGYQYGETELIEYSERLYVEFAKALRTGTGPVSVGEAAVRAKQTYLQETANMRPIHEKVLLETAIFGLPMLSVDMQGDRLPVSSEQTIVQAGHMMAASSEPGSDLGLYYADETIQIDTDLQTKSLQNVSDDTDFIETQYYSGKDGVVSNPAEPVLPLALYKVNAPAGFPTTPTDVLMRGVSFLGGSYTEDQNVIPLTGAATTEIRGIHTPFIATVFYPVVPWEVNYTDNILNGVDNGDTVLALTPMQFLSNSSTAIDGTMRVFDSMRFRFYYSGNTEAYENTEAGVTNIPAVASPPVISIVSSEVDSGMVNFDITVTSDPSAGVHEVRITYTALSGAFYGSWDSVELTRDAADSRLWHGSLALNGTPADQVRFIAQAVNGVGLTSMATNMGRFYIPGVDPGQPDLGDGDVQETTLTLQAPVAASGAYGTDVTFSAELTSNGTPLANQVVQFGLTSQQLFTKTNSNGIATAKLTLVGIPTDDLLRVTFDGTPGFAPSADSSPFTITPVGTSLTLLTTTPVFGANAKADLAIALADATGRPLREKSVILTVGTGGSVLYAESIITNLFGNAILQTLPLAPGTYDVNAYFGQQVTLSGGTVDLSDPRYLPSQASLQIKANTLPTADAGGPYYVDEGSTVQLTGSGADADAGQDLSYAWDIDGQPGFEESGTEATFSAVNLNGTAGATVNVTFRVCDPVECATDTAVIHINNVPPIINSVINDGPVEPGVMVTVTVDATDVFDSLQFSFDCDGNSTYDVGPQASNIGHCLYLQPGTYTVNVLVDDGDDPVTGSTDVVVYDPSRFAFENYCLYAAVGPMTIERDVDLHNCSIGSEGVLIVKDLGLVDGNVHGRQQDVTINMSEVIAGTVAAAGNVTIFDDSDVGEDVLAGGDITILKRVDVAGDVLAVGDLSIHPSAKIHGTTSDTAQPPVFPEVKPVVVTIIPGTNTVIVSQNAVVTLPPGIYGDLDIQNGAMVTLSTGEYRFKNVIVDNTASLKFDVSSSTDGHVTIGVSGNIDIGHEVTMQVLGGDAADVLFRVGGTDVHFKSDSTLIGTYVAPNAAITVENDIILTGALFGKEVWVKTTSVIYGQPALSILSGG